MKELSIVVFTMKGCPHCVEFKKMLKENDVKFYDRDIDEYKEEYDLFSEITNNDMIPALLIVETLDDKHESFLYVPEKDYDLLTEALELVNKHRKSFGII
jgi:glutaredoxin